MFLSGVVDPPLWSTANTDDPVPLTGHVLGLMSFTPQFVACLAAVVVACVLTVLELRRETSWAGMLTGRGWTVAAVGADAVIAALAATGVASTWTAFGHDMTTPAALVTGAVVGLAPVGVAALPLRPAARNRVADARAFLAGQVVLADARYQSTFVDARAAEIETRSDVAKIAERAAQFVDARGRQGKLSGAADVARMLRTLRTDPATDRERLRTVIQVLLDHEGRALVNDMRKEAKAADKATAKANRAAVKAAGRAASLTPLGTRESPAAEHTDPLTGTAKARRRSRLGKTGSGTGGEHQQLPPPSPDEDAEESS